MKKFLSYILTFALMFFISAAATVSMAYFGSNGNLIKPNTSVDGSVGNTSLFNGILETFQKKKQFNIKGELELESEELTIPVTIYVNADINDMENMMFEGFILYQKDQVSFAIEFSFYNNTIYLTQNNSNIKIEVKSITDFIDYITELVEEKEQTQKPEINEGDNTNSNNKPSTENKPSTVPPVEDVNPPKDEQPKEETEEGGDILEELMPTLMDALNNMKETLLENELKQVELSVPDLADVVLIVDKNNAPKKVDLTTASFKGYKLKASLELEFNEYIEITNPEEIEPLRNYFNLKELANIVQNIPDLKNFNSNVNFNINNKNVNFNLLANTNNNSYKLNLINNDFGFINNLKLTYVNNDLYLNFNNINVLVSQELINELTNISLDKEILTSLIPEIKESLGTLDLVKSLTNKIQISSAKDVLGLLSVFENFEISKDYITVTVNTNVLGLNIGKIKLTIGYNQENIKQISIQGLEANNNSIDVDIKLETLNQEINVENKESYINVYDFYKDNFDFFKLGELDLDFNLSLINENLDKYNLNSAIKFNLDNNYLSLNLLTKIKNTNVNVEIEYVDDCAFVKINNVKVKMSKAQAKELINNLNLTQTQNFNIDPIINNLTSKLKTINPLELLKVLSIVKDVRVNNEVVCVDINLKDLGYDLDVVVTIELLNNIISKIYVNLDETNNGLDFSLNINSNQISKNNINKNEYLEITEFVNGLNNLLTLTEGEVKVDIDALVNNKDYDLDLLVKASLDESYANINLELNGNKNLDANLTYYNNIAFVNLNNMFVKFESESLLNLIGLIIKTSNITKDDVINQVNSLGVTDKVSNFINSLNLDKLAYIKNITINSSLIELTLDKFLLGLNDDLVLSITLLENSIKYIETYVETDVQNNLSVKIEFVSDLVEKEEVEEDKYLSIEKTLSNIEKLIYSNVLNVSLSVDVFSLNLEKELGFSLDFSKLYENGSLNLDALIKLVLGENNFDLGLIHENGVSYIEYNGLKVLIETNRITESIERVLSLVNIDINNYKHIINKFVGLLEGENITSLLNNVKFENLDIDYEKLSDINISGIIPVMLLMANELKIDSNQISFVVNGEKLGINTDINLVISFNNGEVSNIKLTKLKVFDKFVDVNINIDMNKKDLPGVEEEVKDKYIDIAEITEMIESFKSTFKNLTFSGDITTNLNVNNEKVSVNVKYGAKYVDSKLTAYLKTTILGIDINLYFLNNTIYADIQGMKINVKLNEINKLLSFIQDEFGLKIEKENNIDIPEVSFSEIIGLISTINLDKISEIVYNENTIDVTFINGLNIFVNYNNIINKIKVIYNDFMVEFNIDSISDFTLDIEESKFESYQEIIDLYNSALNTINNLRNIDATLTLNILKDKIANQISVNVLANILENNYKVSLLNNTYGYVNNLNLAYLNNNFYAYVNNYSVLLSEELINVFKGLIAQNITEEDINNIIDFVKDQKTNVDLKVILGALKYIDEIKLTKTSISIKILKSSLGMGEGTIDVTLSHNNNILTGLSVENIKLFGYEFDLDIDLRETEDKVNVLVPETYFDIYDVVNQNINFFNDLALDFDLIVKSTKNQKELLNANIKYDIHNNYYGIDVFVGYKNGHAVQVEIVGDEAYLKVDNVKVKISAEQAFEIISKFDLNKAKEETNQIKNEVISKLQKLTPQDIIKIIASISIDKVSSEGVIVSIKGEALNLSENVIINITLVNNIINSITINEIIKDNKEFDISININSNVVNPNDINEDEYVDVVGLVENVIDLFKSTSGEIDLDIDALIKGVQYILDLDFEGDLNKGYFDLTAELKEGYSIFTNLTMIDGVLYLNINDAYVSVNVETIIGLILGNIDVESMKQEMSTIEKDELINKLMNLVKSFDINLITKIKSVVVNSSYIEIIVDKSVLGGTQDLVVKIDLLNNVPYIVTITNLYINSNIQINSLVLNFAEKTIEVKELEDKYLSVETIIENNIEYFNDLSLDLDILISKVQNNSTLLEANIKYDIHNNYYGIDVFVGYKNGHAVQVEIVGDEAYLKVDNIKVKISAEQAFEIISKFDLAQVKTETSNVVNNIVDVVLAKLSDISTQELLKMAGTINYITANSDGIVVSVNGSAFGFANNVMVELTLIDGVVRNIFVSGVEAFNTQVNFNVQINSNVVKPNDINEDEYVDVVGLVENVIDLFKSTSGEIDLDIDALVKGVQYILDLDFEGDLNKGYFDLTAELKEGYSIFTNLTMIDGVLYLNINDAYVSVNVETIIGLILGNIDVESMKQEMSSVNKDEIKEELINNLKYLVKGFDISLITKIKSVVVNSSYIEIVVDKSVLGGTQDLVVKIDLLNNVPYIVTITNLYINSNIQINSLVLNFAEKTVEVKELEDKYLSIEETIEKAQSMLELKDLNAIINVDILNSKLENELGLSVDLKKHLENSELSLAALITLISEDSSLILNTRYLNETFFASFNGLNVMLEKDNIVETVHTILSIIGLNENMLDNILVRVINYLETGYISNALKGLNNSNQTEEKTNPTSNFDIKEILDEIINNVQITASEILIDINGSVFGFDSNIYVIISLNNGYISNIYIQELKLEDKFININISLDRSVQNIEKLEIDEKPQVKTFGFAAKIIESLGLTEDYIGEFINLAELTKVIESGYNTIKDGILTGSFGVNFGGLELDINYGFKLVNGKIDAYVSTEYEGINVGVQFTNKTFYVEIQGMKVHANIENIKDIVEWVEDKFGVEINEDMVDEIKSEIQNSVPTTLTEIIDTINSIDFSILDKVVFNENTMEVILSNGETLFASYKEKIEQIRVNVGGVNVEANINTAPSVDQDFEIEVNENEYTSYTALTDLYSMLKETISLNKNFSLGLDININENNINLDALIDVNNRNVSILLNNNSYGYLENANIVIINSEAYIQINDLYVRLTENLFNDAPNLINDLIDKTGMREQLEELKVELEQEMENSKNIDFTKYLQYIKELSIKENGFVAQINANIFGLGDYLIDVVISHENGVITGVRLSNLDINGTKIDAKVSIEKTESAVAIENAEQYLDIYETVLENIEFFNNKALELEVNFEIVGEVNISAIGNIKADLNKNYFGINLEINGDYNANITLEYVNEVAYLSVNGIKVQTSLDKVQNILKEFGFELDIESELNNLFNSLSSKTNTVDNITFEDIWNAINKLELTRSNLIVDMLLEIFGISSNLDLVARLNNNVVNGLSLTNFEIKGLTINANIDILSNNVKENQIETEEYLDIAETILNAKELIYANIINLLANVRIYDSELNYKFGLDLDLSKLYKNENLMGNLFINLLYENKLLNISSIYNDSALFANINGLKLFLEKERILESVQTVLGIINVNINSYDELIMNIISLLEGKDILSVVNGLGVKVSTPNISLDYEELIRTIISGVEVNSNEIKVTINGSLFGYNENINAIIKLNNNKIESVSISKLRVGDYYFDINLNINTEEKEIIKVSNEEKEKYINLAELTKVIEAGYNTIKDGILTGSFGVNFGGLELDINYGLKLVNGKIDAYVSTEYKGINVEIQLTDNTIYLDIQGLKVHVNLDNIEDIINWVESEFGIEINKNLIDEIKNDIINEMPSTLNEVLNMIHSIDFSILSKVVFNENTMEVVLSSGETLFISYKDKLEVIRVNIENVNAEVIINPTSSFEIEVNENEYTSYTALTDLYSMLKETISLNKNFNLGLDVNINENNINLDALIDVNNRNVSILLNNNSYGYLENANIVIINSEAYIQINDLYVRLTENLFNDAPNLINDLIDKTGMREQLEELKVELEQEMENSKNIDFTKYLQYIKELSIKENGFVAQINANIFGLGDYLIDVVISHENGVITGVRLSNLDINGTKIDAKVSIEKTESAVAIENAEQYLDIYETVLENIEFFNNKALELEVNFEIVGEVNISAIGNIKADLNKNYFGINLEINGDYNANITLEYVNEVAYLSVNGIKVQTSLDKVQNILKEFGFELDIESGINNLLESINKNSNNIEEITFEDIWNAINKLELTSSNLIVDMLLEIFGINSNLDLVARLNNNVVNGLSLTNFEIKGLTINTNIDILSNNVKENQIETEEYLDIAETILNAKELIYANIINLLANVRIYDSEFNYKFGLDLDLSKIFDAENNYLLANSLLKLLYNDKEFNISSIYENDTMFADINGLKVYLEKERILESVQSILSILNINENNYNDIVMNIISLLEGKDILSVVNNLNVNISTPKMNINYSDLINTLIRNVEVGSERITISMNGEIFGYNENINVVILIENNKISSVVISKLRVGDYYFDINLNINTEEKEIDSIYNQDINQYLNIAEFINIIDATYKTLENKQLSGLITLSFTYAGETNLLNINYGVKFDENDGYIFYITTNFKGLDVNIYYINERFYLDIVGMKIYLTFNDINEIFDWLGQFGLEIDFDVSMVEDLLHGNIEFNISTKEILNLVFGLDLNLINSVIFGENTLEAYLKDNINIFVNYIDVVKKVIFRYNDILVELNCSQFNDVIIDKVNVNEYASYTVLTNTVDAALETINKQQFNLNANAKIYENNSMLNNLDVHLALDLVDKINAYLSFVVDGNTSTDINAAYQNDYLYVNYDNLKLSINQKNFRELLVIALEALGVDPTAISFLADIADEMDIKADNINNIMPNLDFGNPLNLLRIVKHIDIVDGNFMIVLDGAFITNDESANDMTFNIYSNEEGIKAIELLNIYAGKGSSQHFDLRIDINDFEGVKQITNTETYIDISGSANLLESFVNTSNLNDYTVTGTIQVVANIIGINIDMDIPVTVKVKIVEDGNIEAYAVLDIPVIGSNVPGFTGINVNNDVPYDTGDTSVESRKLELMIKDNYVYMHRTDVVNQTVFADRIYEKALKVSTQEFSWNLTYYLLQYGIGMSDAIMGEIDKAFDKAVHREDNPLDISNVLNGYTHVDGSNKHTISINLAEIANNELLGNANIDIYTVNNETTGNKDYIGTLGFVIDMPLASVCTINLETNNLSLINIGQTVDLSNMYSYVNSYSYKENQQWEYTDGNKNGWVMADEVEYTINFSDPMGNNVNSITTTVKSPITLPTLSTIVKNEADGQHTYTFAGWFLDEGLTKEFTETVMPRGNRTLYAKWNESVKYNRTVTLNSMGANQDSEITQLEGSVMVLPNLNNYEVMEGQTKIVYSFAGWFLDESCSTKFTSAYMPNENKTLYAKWVEVERFTAYNMIVYDNGKVVFDKFIQEGTSISFSGFKLDSNTKFYSDYALTNEISKPTIMPSNNLVVHIKNMYTLTIISSYGTVVNSTSNLYQGSSFSLPAQKTYVVDNGTTRTTYTFNGYNNSSNIMPNNDLTVTANWSVDVKHYYTVTFNLCYNGNAAFYKYAKLYKNGVELGSNEISVKVLEGSLDLTEYTAVWEYKVIWKYWYNFQGFSTSKNGSAMSTVQITENTTIYGLWSGLKS